MWDDKKHLESEKTLTILCAVLGMDQVPGIQDKKELRALLTRGIEAINYHRKCRRELTKALRELYSIKSQGTSYQMDIDMRRALRDYGHD